MLKGFLSSLFQAAYHHNRNNILKLAASLKENDSFLDLGCDDGAWSIEVAKAAKAKNIFGVELNETAAASAQKKGLQVSLADLSQRLPFEDNSFDLVHANQVIEHVSSVDVFTSEAFRVLKPGGKFIVSTENGSSWHNIFAAVLGWQIFSLTNLSSKASGVGNPLALHRGTTEFSGTWTHKVIFNYRGLIEFLALHGFKNIKTSGAGYYPLPSAVAGYDPRHAHFLTSIAQKPVP